VVPATVVDAALRWARAGQLGLARDEFARWLDSAGLTAEPWEVLLDLCVAQGDWSAALQVTEAWQAARVTPRVDAAELRLADRSSSPWFSLALRASQAGRFAEACGWWQAAAREEPSNRDVWGNLAACELACGHLDAAEQAARQSVSLDASFATGWDRLGLIAQARGQGEVALEHHDRATRLDPALAGAWINLAAAALSQERAGLAQAAASRALKLEDGRAEAWFNRAAAADHLGRTLTARQDYAQALRLRPQRSPVTDAWRIQQASLLPAIYPDVAAVETSRSEFTRQWQSLEDAGFRFDPTQAPCPIRFRLAYQGQNDRPLQAQIASVMSADARQPVPAGSGGKRLRVGFVSRFLKEHTVGQLTAGLILGLDATRFETVVMHLGTACGPLAERLRSGVARSVELPLAVEPAAQAIRDARLDVLVYPDIGMEPVSLSLSYLRLAPRQLVLWGHPVTTGSPVIDGFVSSELAEPPDASDHYSERLLKLPLLPGILDRPTRIDRPVSREELGLPATGRVYLCPQSLFKLHPEMDRLFEGIATRDATGWIGLIEPPEPEWRRQLEARWKGADGEPADWARQVVWIPRVDPVGFLDLLACADVLLDTRPFGGGFTTYQALALGTPVVTWPGEFLRGRVTLGCYRQMGVERYVARSAEKYVELSLAAAQASPRERRELADAAGALFGRTELMPAWEGVLRGEWSGMS
jgi:protein O-GlcNAc transferase